MSDRTSPPYGLSSDDVQHCPLCDVCVSTTGRPFETGKSVVGHIVSAHEGYGYPEARSLVFSSDGDASREVSSSDDSSDESDKDQTMSENTESVSFDEPSGGESAEPTDNNDVTLPCGHESYDPAEAPEPPYPVECDMCGESWRVTE